MLLRAGLRVADVASARRRSDGQRRCNQRRRGAAFPVVVGGYLTVSVLRPVLYPLLSGWLVGRIEPSVRATVLSARDMFDSAGQIAGGPVVGVIGTFASIRIALLAGAGALVPAAGCIVAASRRIRPRLPAAAGDAGAAAADAIAQA